MNMWKPVFVYILILFSARAPKSWHRPPAGPPGRWGPSAPSFTSRAPSLCHRQRQQQQPQPEIPVRPETLLPARENPHPLTLPTKQVRHTISWLFVNQLFVFSRKSSEVRKQTGRTIKWFDQLKKWRGRRGLLERWRCRLGRPWRLWVVFVFFNFTSFLFIPYFSIFHGERGAKQHRKCISWLGRFYE